MRRAAAYELIASVGFVATWLILGALLQNNDQAGEFAGCLFGFSVPLCFAVSWLLAFSVGDRDRCTFVALVGRLLLAIMTPIVSLVVWFYIAFAISGC